MRNKNKETLKNFQIPEEVFKAIEIFDLIEKRDRILISYSGGPDSTFLTLTLIKLKKLFNLEISLFYLFHKLEGSLPPKKAKEFADKLGLKIFIFEEDIKNFAFKEKLNIEEAGRIKRYSLLEEVAERKGYNKIATAHTLNDALETFFLRFLREGISLLNPPLKPKLKKIIRPLILVEREKIIEILKENEIDYHIDIENYSLKRTRNKIRHKLLPFIFEEFNYNLNKFRNFYIRFIEESKTYEQKLKEDIEKYIEEKNPYFIKTNKQKLLNLDSFEKREILKNILFEWEYEGEVTREMLSRMERILIKGGKIEIKKDLFFVSKGENVLFMKKKPDFEITLREGKIKINRFAEITVKKDKNKGFLPEEIIGKAKIRLRKDGDIIERDKGKILKLKKFFENKKIPFYLRDYLLVVEYKGKIIWIEGFEPFLKGKDIKIEVLKWR